MKVIIFAGGNKEFTASRLGVKLGESLQNRGFDVTVMGVKGKIKAKTPVAVKEFAAVAKPKSLAALLAKEKADFVISLMSLTGCLAAAEAKIPFVYAENEGFKEDKAVKDKKTVLKKAKQIFVIKTSDKPFNKKAYAGLKVREVTNPAVWVEHYNYNKPACFKKENNVVAAGRLDKNSGFDTLLKTWARLAPAHATWHLTIVGDGPTKTALKKFIAKNGLEASTEIVADDGDVYSILRNADIFAWPAVACANADVLLDAMASKLPCVACESEPVTALIANGINGVIVNAGEEEPFTVALDDLMVNWGKRVGMAVEASKMKDRFPLEDFVRSFAGLLN